jgi:hypothetical protein
MVEAAIARGTARWTPLMFASCGFGVEVAPSIKRESKTRGRLHTLLIVAALCFSLVPGCIQAQPLPVNPPKNIADDDLKEYCMFNDRLYSIGAFICVARRLSLQCERPDKGGRASWKSVASPDCELNQSLTPQ